MAGLFGFIRVLLVLIGLTISALLALGRFPDSNFKFEKYGHFVPQMFFALTIVLVVLFLFGFYGKRFKLTLILIPFWFFAGYLIMTPYFSYTGIKGKANNSKKTYTLLTYNSNMKDGSALVGLVKELAPDYIVVTEFSPKAKLIMDGLRKEYPSSYSRAQGGHDGIGIYSKHKAEFSMTLITEEGVSMPVVTAKVSPEGEDENDLTLLGFRAVSPHSQKLYSARNRTIEKAADMTSETEGAAMLTGDFNSTPYTPILRSVKDNEKLHFGASPFCTTWPTNRSRIYLIQIDNCLVNDNIRIISSRRGEKLDSDHYPLIIEFQVK